MLHRYIYLEMYLFPPVLFWINVVKNPQPQTVCSIVLLAQSGIVKVWSSSQILFPIPKIQISTFQISIIKKKINRKELQITHLRKNVDQTLATNELRVHQGDLYEQKQNVCCKIKSQLNKLHTRQQRQLNTVEVIFGLVHMWL